MYIFSHPLVTHTMWPKWVFLGNGNKLSKKGEAKNGFKLLVSSNGLCDKAKQMKKEIPPNPKGYYRLES